MAICIFPKLCFCFQAKVNTHSITFIVRRVNLPFFHVGVTWSLSVFQLASVWNESPWHDGPNPSPSHQQGNLQENKVGVMHSSHLPNLISAIKTCLLKHIFLLPNIWKIYEYCIAFRILVLNSLNTQVIFLVITHDSTGNLKLSSLTVILTVSVLFFLCKLTTTLKMCKLQFRNCFNHLFVFNIGYMHKKRKRIPKDYNYHPFRKK